MIRVGVTEVSGTACVFERRVHRRCPLKNHSSGNSEMITMGKGGKVTCAIDFMC